VAFEGLTHKGVIRAVILVAALLDGALDGSGDALPPTAMIRSAAEFFYIASEGLSIVENAGLMGVPVPRALRQALEALREKKDAPDKPPDQEA
jgi:toxin secretion/phage lysis holin